MMSMLKQVEEKLFWQSISFQWVLQQFDNEDQDDDNDDDEDDYDDDDNETGFCKEGREGSSRDSPQGRSRFQWKGEIFTTIGKCASNKDFPDFLN